MRARVEHLPVILACAGGLLLVGVLADLLARGTFVPRITVMLLAGIVAGPAVLDLLPAPVIGLFPAFADVTLVMVGFLIGGKVGLRDLRQQGRPALTISLAQVAVTAPVVFLGLRLLGFETGLALLLAAIAPATDPVATADVVKESGADGPFARTLLAVVALDDAWGLIGYSVLLALATALAGVEGAVLTLWAAARDLGGAVLVGAALGVPLSLATGRVRPGEPTQAEALGAVLLCAGVSLWLGVSFLLSAMVMGVVVVTLARHHRRPFHAIEGIEWPFMVLFFVLAGATLRPAALQGAGLVGGAYVVLRIVGKLLAGRVGGSWARWPARQGGWMGLALLPQAGVALGMALVSAHQFPDYADVVLPVVIAATVLFELVGPVLTRVALLRAGDGVR